MFSFWKAYTWRHLCLKGVCPKAFESFETSGELVMKTSRRTLPLICSAFMVACSAWSMATMAPAEADSKADVDQQDSARVYVVPIRGQVGTDIVLESTKRSSRTSRSRAQTSSSSSSRAAMSETSTTTTSPTSTKVKCSIRDVNRAC